MATVNVSVKTGWILERMAKELVNRVSGVRMNAAGWPPKTPTEDDIQYFLPAKDIRYLTRATTAIKIGYFTHGEDRAQAYWDRFDVCLTMNRHMAEYLREFGAKRVLTIRPGTEPPTRPITFGVCGRVYGKNRKGAFLVEEAVAAGFAFRACSENQRGKQPPCPITHPIERRSDFYQSIDYLVVTSLDEGGPIPVIEALAHGVPVIAPDVGWCWEFPCLKYRRGDWESLRALLHELTHPPTWEAWAEQHRRLFETLTS